MDRTGIRTNALTVLLLCLFSSYKFCESWMPLHTAHSKHLSSSHPFCTENEKHNDDDDDNHNYDSSVQSRRSMISEILTKSTTAALMTTTILTNNYLPSAAMAAEPSAAASSTAAQVTDKIFVEIKGLTPPNKDTGSVETKRIVIGLFGKDAPQPCSLLTQLVTPEGLLQPCKPKEQRTLQREQLEANKVYNSCMELQNRGVTYDLSTVWRILKDERIDIGSVSGKFVSREFPNWTGANSLTHDAPGVVSVRRGNQSGFGFSIYPGNSSGSNTAAAIAELNENHIVVGRVLEGLDVVQALNQVPVVSSAKVNYMALTGGATTKDAPNRSCRYGGPMYCNENKPLQKLSITKTGILPL
mmetsp:Transcript_7755/g.11156  ORF Transcript_7755/g.11156 Transcript_7755/m.11156 type:complete len:357 (-) Transcript_7755:62-1132(-)